MEAREREKGEEREGEEREGEERGNEVRERYGRTRRNAKVTGNGERRRESEGGEPSLMTLGIVSRLHGEKLKEEKRKREIEREKEGERVTFSSVFFDFSLSLSR